MYLRVGEPEPRQTTVDARVLLYQDINNTWARLEVWTLQSYGRARREDTPAIAL